ncbi:MAG: peptidoglycan-associated lipoprotein [Candidatus Azotimanducaceae bacterium]|jgi:peptidoglycan-associated lipoprotein
MGITRNRGPLALIAVGLFLAGCASTAPEEDTSTDVSLDTKEVVVETPKEMPKEIQPTITGGEKVMISKGPGMGTETLDGIFYFDFDQAIVKRSGHSELDKHASVLKGNPSFRVRLEGHGDERGTREYNLALGERRANGIRAYLTAQGATRSQIEVISYGEEKPAVLGGGESTWAQNRRVAIKYSN